MNTQKQNSSFNALDGLEEGQRELLIADERVVSTDARFTQEEAIAALGVDAALESDFGATRTNTLRFGGNVILPRSPQNWDDMERMAQDILRKRGWNEEILGVVAGIGPGHGDDPQTRMN